MDVDVTSETEKEESITENVNPPPENENTPTETGNTTQQRNKPIDERLKDWNKSEIYDLLQTIKVIGSQNITMLSQNIPTKSPNQITEAISYYRERAKAQHKPCKKRQWHSKNDIKRAPTIPLIGWAKFLQESLSFKDLHTETATALRIIAEFDNIPPPVQTDNIDFRNIYHSIANAMEGKAIAEDGPTVTILNKCIVDTALTSKAFMRLGELQHIVEWIDMSDKPMCVLPRPTDNFEIATLRHLASQRTYNPLSIPELYLKPN